MWNLLNYYLICWSSGLIDDRLNLNQFTFSFIKSKKRLWHWARLGRKIKNENVGIFFFLVVFFKNASADFNEILWYYSGKIVKKTHHNRFLKSLPAPRYSTFYVFACLLFFSKSMKDKTFNVLGMVKSLQLQWSLFIQTSAVTSGRHPNETNKMFLSKFCGEIFNVFQ